MNPITQAQLRKGRTNQATGRPITKQAVSKAVSKGKLTTCEVSGRTMIDLDGHLTVEWIRSHPIQASVPIQKIAKPQTEPEETHDPPPPQTPASAYLPQGNNPSGTGDPGNLGLKDRKTQEEILRLEIANDQKRTTLILKESVTTLFGKIHAIDTNQFKTLGPNVNQQIDSIYNETNHIKSKKIVDLFRSLLNIQGVKIEIGKETESEITKILETGSEDNKTEINRVMEDETGKILKNIQREIDDFIRANDELEVG